MSKNSYSKNGSQKQDFNQLDWVKVCKEYYKDHDPNLKYGSGGVTVTVLMEIESFAKWLSDKGYLQ